jgi:hypothetical protein
MSIPLDGGAPEPVLGQAEMDLLERLFVLMRTVGTLGPNHPSALQSAMAASDALALCHPPLSFQFVREATFCDRQLLPLDLESFHRAQTICKALNNLHVQELSIGRQLPAPRLLELGVVLARGVAGPTDLLDTTRLPGVEWRELPGAGWGTESRQIDPDLFAVTNLSLAVQEAELMCDLAVPWDWVRGVSVVRRLERATTADLHAANRALEFVAQPWTQARRAVALALRVVAVLLEMKTQPAVTRASGHAALMLGCSGLTDPPQPLEGAAGKALPRGLAAAGKTQLGAARHQIRVMSILHAILKKPQTQALWPGPVGAIELCYRLESRRVTSGLANLTLGDLLAAVLPEVGKQLDPAWFRALIATVGTLPPGARVRLADGGIGVVIGPGAAGDPWRPQVLVGALVVEPDRAVDLIADGKNTRGQRGYSPWA